MEQLQPVSIMVHKSQHQSADYELKACVLPPGAAFFADGGGAYFFVSDKCHYAFDDHLECILKVNLKHICHVGSRFGHALALAASNSLYYVDTADTVQVKKSKKRILHVHMLSVSDVLQVSICRTRKMLQLVLGGHTLGLESYSGRCNYRIIFASLVYNNVFCLSYVDEGGNVKIALIAIGKDRMTLIRKDCFRQAQNAKMSRALGTENLFLIECDGERSVLSYDQSHCSMVLMKQLSLKTEASVRLVDEERILQFVLVPRALRIICDGATADDHVEYTIPLDGDHCEILSVKRLDQAIAVLINVDGKGVVLCRFRLPCSTSHSILDNDMLTKTEEELSTLIRSGKIPINSQLVDHIMANNLESCAVECLKSLYIPEEQAVRIITKDTSLLKELIEHTKGDQQEIMSAIRQHVSKEKCAEIIQQLLDMLDRIEMFGSQQVHCYKRIIAFMNILMDAMLFNMHEAGALKDEWIDKLKALVKHCHTESHNLQSLLSFTNSLLKRRVNKEENDKSSLIVVLPISYLDAPKWVNVVKVRGRSVSATVKPTFHVADVAIAPFTSRKEGVPHAAIQTKKLAAITGRSRPSAEGLPVLAGSAVARSAPGTHATKRLFAAESAAIDVSGEYVLKPVPGESGKFYLSFKKDKMASLKDLSFIDFTKNSNVQKGEFLLSVESAKTMFDFMSPATLKIIAFNKKFVEKPTEDILKKLKDDPEIEDNYLMIVEMA
ncbi:uncharacterized protein BXIN_1153 [Babesia sp. Xinjiang]|uniref:uncharacterized protein n=1 Tax=Babesia sp. Xinjiang TaxID=462227 RepID=UPI000A2293CF|nr:uncharacterized protein BXIN_1153 [Babesia sp. Xinjiang]ORM40138.1 hypothetical protein BXIN_1153 [Babesia sp. Xinjiang]